MRLRPATVADAEAIRAIYNTEVETSTATMDLVARSLTEQRRWLEERSGAFATLVAVTPRRRAGDLDDAPAGTEEILGFAALSPYKERAAYRTTVEDSVYVRRDQHGRGIGRLLLEGILDTARESGFHSVMARVEAGREPSLRLHTRCGFDVVGVEREVARKFSRWLDVVLLQCLLDGRRPIPPDSSI